MTDYTAEQLEELLRHLDQVVADNTVGGDGLTYIGALARQSAKAIDALVKRAEAAERTVARDTDESCTKASKADCGELYRAVRASHAWAYCEHMGLGSFAARCTLCAYAEYLCAKAFALADGREFDGKYKGSKRMIVWPQVRLEESSEAEAEALVAEALEHEATARAAATCAECHERPIVTAWGLCAGCDEERDRKEALLP